MGILDKLRSPGSQLQIKTPASRGRRMSILLSYVEEVAEILRSIRRGSHLASMIPTELEEQARDWSEIFYGIIPEDRLRESYVAAEQNPERRPEDRNFPLRRREILDAFYRLQSNQPAVIDDECDFCEMYFKSPTEYQPCPFHKQAKDLVGR